MRKPVGAGNNYKDGRRSHPLYNTFTLMRNRCNNPKASNYARYGGRGVRVFVEWDHADGWSSFVAHVETLPNYGRAGYTLDRIDNDGDYRPGNVRWATAVEQAHNARHTKLNEQAVKSMRYVYWNCGKTLKQIAAVYGVTFANVSYIMRRKTWANVPHVPGEPT